MFSNVPESFREKVKSFQKKKKNLSGASSYFAPDKCRKAIFNSLFSLKFILVSIFPFYFYQVTYIKSLKVK